MTAAHKYYYFTNRAFTPQPITLSLRLVLSKFLFIFGFILLIWVAYPLARFQLVDSRKLAQNQFLLPGGDLKIALSPQILTGLPDLDYTQAANWFPHAQLNPPPQDMVTQYALSIPKLKIDQAIVNLSGEDLSKSLIHYGGTAVPGQLGNGVIFGHSILPQFYNPKNYMAIFSTLHTLKNGDQIIIEFDNITFQYQIIDMFEVSPQDISVLDQTYDSQYLTLITCTPPGTYLRRLIVKAKLVPYT